MRQRSEKERLRGVRTSYLGSETYLSLVDAQQAPYPASIEQLAVTALCSNRDLPLLLAAGAGDLFHLPDGGPVASIWVMVSPTSPRPTLAQGDASWRLISHLSLNYLSIVDADQGGGASALRELVGIYAPRGDRVTEKGVKLLAEFNPLIADHHPLERRAGDAAKLDDLRQKPVRPAMAVGRADGLSGGGVFAEDDRLGVFLAADGR